MYSYTVHYTRTLDVPQTGTILVRAENADDAIDAGRSILHQSYPGEQVIITRSSEVNDHRHPNRLNSYAGLQAVRAAFSGPHLDYAGCSDDGDGRCRQHGGYMRGMTTCQTVEVLADVRAERSRQFARYGTNEDIADGTGPGVEWLQGADGWSSAKDLEVELRAAYVEYEQQHGTPTWRHLVLEEVAEVFMEDDLSRLREELVQVAALAVSWIEKIDGRNEVR